MSCEATVVPAEVVRPSTRIILFDIDNTLFNTPKFKQTGRTCYEVYPEVHMALEILVNRMGLGILSQEKESNLQGTKLLETGIADYFDYQHVHIVPDKFQALPEILGRYKGRDVTYVDDKLDILAWAKEIDPRLTAVWLKRGEYANTQVPIAGFRPDFTFPTISGLVEALTFTDRLAA